MSPLPKGWNSVKLPDVLFFQEGPGLRTYQYRESGIPFLNIRTFVGERIDRSLCKFLDAEEVREKYSHFLANAGDIVVATSGSLGKLAIIHEEDLPLVLNTSITRFRPHSEKIINHRFAYWFLKSDSFFAQARAVATGSAQLNFGPSHIREFIVPLPPPDEQRRVAMKLDRLSCHSNRARAELVRIPRLVERYKQAVLAAAFRGQLTGDDADRWPVVTLGDLIGSIDAGKNIRCEERPPKPSERGIVKVSSVSWGTFDPLAAKTPDVNATLDLRSLIQTGDFLISRANTLQLVGACVVVGPLLHKNLYLSDKILRIRFTQPIEHWVLHFLRSVGGRNQIEGLATGNQLSMRNISQAAIRAIHMPLPPEDVRSRVLDSVQKALAAISATLNEATRATELLYRLDQATLAKAFRGELAYPR
ncbi:MAG: restriction endonuclease subunit S [Terriglobales bacterium]|jgi:type I restriction enzyme S subunit